MHLNNFVNKNPLGQSKPKLDQTSNPPVSLKAARYVVRGPISLGNLASSVAASFSMAKSTTDPVQKKTNQKRKGNIYNFWELEFTNGVNMTFHHIINWCWYYQPSAKPPPNQKIKGKNYSFWELEFTNGVIMTIHSTRKWCMMLTRFIKILFFSFGIGW